MTLIRVLLLAVALVGLADRAQTEMRKIELDDLKGAANRLAWSSPEPASDLVRVADTTSLVESDPTLARGAYISDVSPVKGIVLHLHGCDGPSFSGWIEAWFRYLENSGLKVIAPNSFNEPRPGQSCNTAPPFPDQEEIAAVRLKQTLRVSEIVKRTYPDVPLYVWGHSEGASLAYLLDGQFAGIIAGIIATGHVCGHRAKALIRVPSEVPLLSIMGSAELDPYLSMNITAGQHGSLATLCQRVMANNRNWKWVQFDDLAHFVPIWHPGVLFEVSAFLKTLARYRGPDASIELAGLSDIKPGANAKSQFESEYRKGKGFRAFAIGPGGTYGYGFAPSSIHDAKLNALYFCNRYLVQKLPARRCVVYAEGDKVVFKE
jgi:hypothetical protein